MQSCIYIVPHSVHVIRHVIARVGVADLQPETGTGQIFTDELQSAELAAFAAVGTEIVGSHSDETGAAQRGAAAGERVPLRSFDVHLQIIHAADAVLLAEPIEGYRGYRIARG